ncbi:hypothetical protein ACOCEA_14855 [Maribacter sp. CXY002]|uniref:hypothetical protein n=1 Tax=Maribacter luteocoastalis TaxID=3407671 RepID=UPI003B674F9C
MRIVKQIVAYLLWTVLSFILGIAYMRLFLGPNNVPEEGLWYLLHLFFEIGLIQVGLWGGAIIAFCFIFLDVLYLRNKLINNPKKTIIRLALLLIITVMIAIAHYILEKVIDVI